MDYQTIIPKIRQIYYSAISENFDLWGCSVLDLMCDNLPNYSVEELKGLIKMADLPLNERLQKTVEKY